MNRDDLDEVDRDALDRALGIELGRSRSRRTGAIHPGRARLVGGGHVSAPITANLNTCGSSRGRRRRAGSTMAIGVAQGVDGGAERLVCVLVDVDQPGQGRGDPEVEPVTLGIERVSDGLFAVATTGGREFGGRGLGRRRAGRPTVGSRWAGRPRRRRSRPLPGTAAGRQVGSAGRHAD